jgi:hypothetical protein
VGQAATVDWPGPAATMNPNPPHDGTINPQHLSLTNHPAQSSNPISQIASQLVAPSDILQYDRPVKRDPGNRELVSLGGVGNQGMDKRHPSSFQQLEKVCHYIAIHGRVLLTTLIAGRGYLCYCMTLPTPLPPVPPT